MSRRAKILGTIGPASAKPDVLRALFRAGLDAVRMNFSHGTPEQHRANAALIRSVAKEVGKPVAILGDLSGPKIRAGTFAGGPVELVAGQPFTLTTESVPGDVRSVSMTYPLANDAKPGDILLLDDGLLRLRVERVEGPAVHTIVEVGGPLSDRKGINAPGTRLSTPALTDKDRRDLPLARELGVDYLALSFVRTAEDLRECKELAGDIPVIAKLEKPEAVANLDAIIAACDGIMVARGDMGVELGSEKVPMVQKRAIAKTNAAGKLVITATQMLDSMIRNPRPTRAEAADVANAVLDGTDVLMLSGEMASGSYPVESVQTMASIINEVEGSEIYAALSVPPSLEADEWDLDNACARAAALTSRSVKLAAIVVPARTGRTADLVAEYRPHAPVVALAESDAMAQRLALQWGVYPVRGAMPAAHDEAIALALKTARETVGAQSGQTVAVLLGHTEEKRGHALALHRVG